ncbi:MAG TPA: carbohydrate ABC transporter permease [Firmicutes bacterium]|nr:carbohydrate ABC transporter permease [Bacillota bacterium]
MLGKEDRGLSRKRKRTKGIIILVLAVAAALWAFMPFYWAISTSLRSPLETFTIAGLGIPFIQFRPTLANWIDQLSIGETQRALLNSTIVAVFSAVIALILGIPAAYALARFRFFAIKNKDITVWFLSQRVLPPVVTVIPFFLMMRSASLLDTRTALVLANVTFILPFVVVIMRQTFADLPVELEESALVDGATHFGILRNISLPLAAPAIAATALIILAFTWNEFLFALTLGSRQAVTIPVHMAGAVDTRGVQFWFMAVRALVAMLPPTLLALFAQRYIVRGLTLGALKG